MLPTNPKPSDRSLILTALLCGAICAMLCDASFAHGAGDPEAPSSLRCEYLSNPLGIDVREPRFAWVLNHTQRAESQTAYQVLVASRPELLDRGQGDQWDSGKVASDDSTQVVYHGKPLESGHAYYWKVRFWDSQDRVSPSSEPARFEMGLLSRDEWKGHWITGNELRKGFELPGKVVRARVYVTALGYYELHLNGKKIGDNVLDPAWTSYNQRVLYSTYDVTRQLQPGANAIGVMLGGGWATLANSVKPYYPAPALLLEMSIELEGGKQVSIESDGSWKASRGPVVSDSVYDGEVYDARLETPGWDRPAFDDSSWSAAQVVEGSSGVLSAQMMPPIRVVDSMMPARILNPKPGVYVYDMGQNMSGWVELRVRGPRGAAVKLRFSELIYTGGMINRDNIREAKSRDIYLLRGKGEEVYEPRFTYHGFRYVEVKGYPGTPGLDSIRGRVAHSAVETTGNFAASKSLLNQIQHLVWWSELTNLFSVPTDCDQRNERQGWMGDTQVTAEEAMMNFDMAAFYTNFVRDIRDVQGPDGTITDTVPWKYGSRPADPAWGTAYPQLVWYMWQQYGDRRILEENYDTLKKYVDFLRSRAQDGVLRYSYYGDWVSIVDTPGALVSDAYYYYDTTLLKSIATVLGKTGDAQAYAQRADQIKSAFNREFFDAKTGDYGTQTANAMALGLGLAPENERSGVSGHLRNDVVYHHNTHPTTGFIGIKFLLPALTDNGNNDVAYDLATQNSYPSWGYMIEHGATTLWELWQEKTGPSMNSHDHAMFGSVGAWFYQALAGINLGANGEGYRHLRIAPQIVEDLHWASATIHTLRGTVSSSWTHSSGEITLEVTVPVGSDAEVVIPTDPEMTAVTVREGDRVVWQNGQYVAGDDGIRGARQADGHIVLNVGSGRFAFHLIGE